MRSIPRLNSPIKFKGLVDIKSAFAMVREEFVYQNVYQFVYQTKRNREWNRTLETFISETEAGTTIAVCRHAIPPLMIAGAYAFLLKLYLSIPPERAVMR